MQITNVDESGKEIKSIDWREWDRIEVVEITNENNEVIGIESKCRRITPEEKMERLRIDLEATAPADIEAAICELAEQQAAYENDVNAALCELYELIEGGN